MYKIDKKLLIALLQYLATRPYAEVHEAIRAIQGVEKIKSKTS